MERLTLFFARIRELTFWQRLFLWRSTRELSYHAFEEYKSLQREIIQQKSGLDLLEKKYEHVVTVNETLQQRIGQQETEVNKKDFEIGSLRQKTHELGKSVSKYETSEGQRTKEHDERVARLNQLKETLEKEITRLSDERLREKHDAVEKMKRQWNEHEVAVKQSLKLICQRHMVRYVEEVPFRGSPDNTLEICDEYIIFDAKCPSNDDLNNFPKYIKAQTEIVKKYANQETVKKDIFLVVPTNTIHTIAQCAYNMGDYNVFVVTTDALEPIILSLKKIEDYEFVNQLSPEERDNICRVIGKFAHTTKRKIQIDQFFASEFLDLLGRCKNDLPADFLMQVIEFEKAERLNPPSEKKTKQILTKELQDKHLSLNAEAGLRDVIIPISFEEMKNLE